MFWRSIAQTATRTAYKTFIDVFYYAISRIGAKPSLAGQSKHIGYVDNTGQRLRHSLLQSVDSCFKIRGMQLLTEKCGSSQELLDITH